MSEHGHDEHGGQDEHAAHDAHDSHGAQDEHGGHGQDAHDDHGHGGGAGDYNTEPPGQSTLPAVPGWMLALMGSVMVVMLAAIVSFSLALGGTEGQGKGHGEAPGAHEGHADSKAAH